LAGAVIAKAQSSYEPYAVSTFAGATPAVGGDAVGGVKGFNFPSGLAVDSAGNLYVANTDDHTISKVTSAGLISTLAGVAGSPGYADGAGGEGGALFSYPKGVAVDGAGNVYVADAVNQIIRKITPDGVVSTLAGQAGSIGSVDGASSAARFYYPYGVAVDRAGNVYVADTFNSTIRKITPAGVVSTLAGLSRSVGNADGAGSTARFSHPSSLTVDNTGNIYVADTGNSTIRKIDPAGVVTTLAGLAGSIGSADRAGSAARFNSPNGVAVDSAGCVYVADTFNSTIRKITPAGVVTTLAGLDSRPGNADGTGNAARFDNPEGVAVDRNGNVYVADTYNQTIRVARPPGYLHFETENLTVQAKSTAAYGALSDANASGSAFTLLQATGPGDFVTYTVPIPAAGTYDVRVGVKTRNDEGIFQLAIEGANLGDLQDEYSSTVGYELRDLDAVTFDTSGQKAFQFSLTGRDPRSRGYSLGLDYIDLQPAAESGLTQTGSLTPPATQTDTFSPTPSPTPSPPAITTQPANKTVTVGKTATFSVKATGTAPLSYQWRKNGANITGATSASYTTPPTTAADNGSLFSVVVSNSAGSVTSNNAMLTVN
jgi:sugar lactone lactonase YvrE